MKTRLFKTMVVTAAAAAVTLSASPAGAATATLSDGADDAYRLTTAPIWPATNQPANPLLTDATADIRSATMTNVAAPRKQLRAYTVSMTITGTPSTSYSYVVAGEFGDGCVLYHPVRPGITTRANAFCFPTGQPPRYLGRIEGSVVTLSGSTLTATFTYDPKQLPPELKADSSLSSLFAYTCVSGAEGLGCRPEEVLDVAEGGPASSFTI